MWKSKSSRVIQTLWAERPSLPALGFRSRRCSITLNPGNPLTTFSPAFRQLVGNRLFSSWSKRKIAWSRPPREGIG